MPDSGIGQGGSVRNVKSPARIQLELRVTPLTVMGEFGVRNFK
jgi:hypothetical protein